MKNENNLLPEKKEYCKECGAILKSTPLIDYIAEEVKDMLLSNILVKFKCHIACKQKEYFDRFTKMLNITQKNNESYHDYMKRATNELIKFKPETKNEKRKNNA